MMQVLPDGIARLARRSRSAAIGVIFVLAVVTPTPSADASNWYGNTGYHRVCPVNGNITDNKTVSIDYIDASNDMFNAMYWVRTERLDPTELDTTVVAEGGAKTDVILRDRYYTDWCMDELEPITGPWTTNGITGLFGLAACYEVTQGGRCQQQVVRISEHWFDAWGDTRDRFIVGHEVGHAIGLVHRNASDGFMVTDLNMIATTYTQHDRDHINSNW